MLWAIHSLWREIMTPSKRDETPYLWAVIFIGHAMLGAALSGLLLGFVPVILRLAAAAAYWWVKERGDLQRGGAARDGLIDTSAVILGLCYPGPALWPIAVMLFAGGGAILRGKP